MKKKSNRGRRPGQLGKAHSGIKDPNEHIRIAASGNFPPDVQHVAYWLTVLAKEREKILAGSREQLEQSKTPRDFLILALPDGDSFSPSEREMLRETGLDVHWLLQKTDHLNNEPLLILSRLLDVVKNRETAPRFFKELARRFEAESPTDGPVEPLYSRLAELKRLFQKPDLRKILYKRIPDLRGAHKSGVRTTQMRAFIERYYKRCVDSDRTLLRVARAVGLKPAARGRP